MTENFVIVKYNFEATGPNELSIRKNQRLRLIDDSKDWWKVQDENNATGFVPSNYVRREKGNNSDDILMSKNSTLRGLIEDKNSNHSSTSIKSSNDSNNLLQHSGKYIEKNNILSSMITVDSCKISCGIALYPYEPQRDDELKLSKNDYVEILEKSQDGWWKGRCGNAIGWFPSNYIDEQERIPTISGNEKILEIVEALYNFNAQNEEELSFDKGELLEILDHPEHDPEWWLARNSRNKTGLVPINYIKVKEAYPKGSLFNFSGLEHKLLNQIKSDTLLKSGNLSYYYGKISREVAENHLNSRGVEGDFLVRDSESNPGDYSISLKGNKRNKHFWIQVDKLSNTYKIGQRTFLSMELLIEHYKLHPIFSSETTNEKLFLIKPLPKEI
ncbi:Dreadlocks [Strongyloides ratti]|uniref:Dreadlocks n=1 Tax=Strongyloides ratti TaxID=34506 RepID=A0A090L8E5_STRRB|nr:Dreadlocks [Strongyloides ratti]CEF63730.1 Dreadlocks [Strongyloides ratti]